ncbi:hypothetical protein [Streptomyces sp. NPDC047108]|uniref:hypothetical protein n=1 Tax=Streptomyces sp. NPDC047108 TaxID=3155025 RepID=UPI0033FD931C
MSERPEEGAGDSDQVPRDMPDQQAGGARTPEQWYAEDLDRNKEEAEAELAENEHELPDTDEAGTGRRDTGRTEDGDEESPPPVEPTD